MTSQLQPPSESEHDFVYVMPVRVGHPPGTIQLGFLWHAALSRWWLVLGTSVAAGLLALALSFLITPIYRAQVIVLSIAEDSGSNTLSQLSSQFGGLAALAGVSLGAPEETRTKALAMLNGRSFTEDFVRDNKMLPVLFSSKWDSGANKWNVTGAKVPTLQDGAEKFRREVLTIMDDPKTSLISVTVEWRDSDSAAQWANGIIDMLNSRMRAQAIDDASARLKFLDRELTRATELELRTAIYSLMESQLKSIMVAKTRQDYALQILDRAMPSDPDKYIRPNRILLACLGLFAGAVLGVGIAVRSGAR